MHNCNDLIEVSKWFDTLDCNISWARQLDKNITLDKFLKLIDSKSQINLHLASPDPFDIRYCVRLDEGDIERFAWINCPYNNHNFKIIEKLYEKSFNCKLKNEPILNGLLEHYNERIKLGY